ncbi:PEP-CTERM-box response regulator transcription factor [Aestuariirhabdus litorea]|uniref:PEP-CTERM-box response regulator transcription factor n=1 Tax=Aestuariirhabdus litorea TaxID=2528527 RepID=A0A3P3VV04_9GAMM|nr:PEP-CTERM-box response regulator transcription factor [Aestuariirhabdus litorea]RRJ84573.1 PEP-CTERM-box response regulator transcription factor [Aestuariirhabdus litorea]RWW97799.1 PEP-CTERM-box response regulator transcription factor [Endozoicomonadaceae bacterium GTF-13]
MTGKRVLLVIEDDIGLQKQMKWSLGDHDIRVATDMDSALVQLRKEEPAVVTLDLGLPPDPANASQGLALLERVIAERPSTKVIVVTGNNDRENAVKAVSMGAYDFYQKPIDIDELKLIIDRAYRLYDLEEENRKLQQGIGFEPLRGVIACSEIMQSVTRTVEKVAPSEISVLLLGESGTGKEVLAKALHSLSGRKGRFVAVNCAAIPETLLESELFGHERGAFTGAVKQTVGKIEYANEGTFFLDEIGDLPIALQTKLLRFLQERTIERIGGRGEIPVDVRVICATHQNLEKLIEEGLFRSDLYYRISEMSIEIPPLRMREGDSVVIASALIERLSNGDKRPPVLTDESIMAIEAYAWPGNIRELENRIKRALIMAEHGRILPADLQLEEPGEDAVLPFNLKSIREKTEREVISRAIGYTDNNISRAAELLGVTRPTLYSLMHKYGIMETKKVGEDSP